MHGVPAYSFYSGGDYLAYGAHVIWLRKHFGFYIWASTFCFQFFVPCFSLSGKSFSRLLGGPTHLRNSLQFAVYSAYFSWLFARLSWYGRTGTVVCIYPILSSNGEEE